MEDFLSTILGLAILGAIGYGIYWAAQNDTEVKTVQDLPPSVQNAFLQMPPADQSAFFMEFNQKRKKVWIGYMALFLLGWHYLYYGKVGVQFAFWFTAGGCGVWWFIDLFRITSINRLANEVIARQALQTLAVGQAFTGGFGAPQQQQQPPQPPSLPPSQGFPEQSDPGDAGTSPEDDSN